MIFFFDVVEVFFKIRITFNKIEAISLFKYKISEGIYEEISNTFYENFYTVIKHYRFSSYFNIEFNYDNAWFIS